MEEALVAESIMGNRLREELRGLSSLLVFVGCVAFAFQSWELSLMWASALGIHEMGHILMISLLRIDWKMGFGIMGAWTETPLEERKALGHFKNSVIHLAGPIFSMLYALIAIGIHMAWHPDSDHLLRLASFSAQVGLFNLLPLGNASDGGKIIHRVLASLDNRGNREITLMPILLLLCLPLGYTVVALLQQGWDKLTTTSVGMLGTITATGVLLTLWLVRSQSAGRNLEKSAGRERVVWIATLVLLLVQLVTFGLMNSGSRPSMNWASMPPQLLGLLLAVLWLTIGTLLARRHGEPGEVGSTRAMTKSQAYFLILSLCIILAIGTVLVLNMPPWLTQGQISLAISRHAGFFMRVWPAVLQVGVFVLLVILLMVLHELGHYAIAVLTGMKVNRIVVGSPKGKLLVRFELAGQTIEIYRKIPIFMALDVDDDALIQAGFWKRTIFALAGPAINFLLVFLTGCILLGVTHGTAIALDFISGTFRAIVVFFLSPIGVGNSAEFFNGFFQETIAAAGASGLGSAAVWWMLLNALIGAANLIPLPALDGGLVLVSLMMRWGKDEEAAAATFERWYQWAPRVAAWLPWVFLGMTLFHIVSFFI